MSPPQAACAHCGFEFASRTSARFYWCPRESVWICRYCASGYSICPSCGSPMSDQTFRTLVFASGFLLMCLWFTAAFGATAIFGHFRGGLDVEVPAVVIPGSVAIILACVILVTWRRVADMNVTHARNARTLIARVVPMTRPVAKDEAIEWAPNERLPGLRSLRWKVPLMILVAVLAALGVLYDGLALNSIGSTILFLVALFAGIFAGVFTMSYWRESRSYPRRFGLSRSGIYVDYPPVASPRRFRYFAWSDLISVASGARLSRLSSLWVKTRFGTTVWWGIPDDFATRMIAAHRNNSSLA
jgi:hypothetical protein